MWYVHSLLDDALCGIVKKIQIRRRCIFPAELKLSALTDFFPKSFYKSVLTRLFFPPLPSEQLIIYQVGILPSHFYNVLADKDYSGFRSLVGKAMVLILINSTVSCQSFGEGGQH